MRKKISLSFIFVLAFIIALCGTAAATQTHTYNISRIADDPNNYNGFWCQAVLPTLTPVWASGTENKINCEFWYPINAGGGTNWVEMGYHNGYAFNSDGSVNTKASYLGCFTARATSSSWRVDTFGSLNWASSQTHTLGNMFNNNPSSGAWTCDMRTDNSVIITYNSSGPGADFTIDAGLEWGVSNAASQSVSKPTNITDLNIYTWQASGGKVWKKWSDIGSVINYNNHTGYTATFDSSNNLINIK
jgi:hypothetical protein